MAVDHGPLQFNNALEWFRNTYGWSAVIRDYSKMQKWTQQATAWMVSRKIQKASGILDDLPAHCNPHWFWINGYDDLRIYAASQKELAFLQLAHLVDQK